MNEAVIKGKAVKILLRDGAEYTILPLTLNQMLDVWPLVAELYQLNDNPDKMDAAVIKQMIKLVTKLLQDSNYPDIDEKKAGDLVDLKDIKRLIAIVMGQNPDMLDQLTKK